MALDKEHIRALLYQVARTREDEIDCDTCLAGMAEFAETQLIDREVSEALRQVEIHLASCPECADEYELLVAMLESEADGPGGA